MVGKVSEWVAGDDRIAPVVKSQAVAKVVGLAAQEVYSPGSAAGVQLQDKRVLLAKWRGHRRRWWWGNSPTRYGR